MVPAACLCRQARLRLQANRRLIEFFEATIRDQAQIRFQLAEPGRVFLRISDVAGRTIATPVDDKLIPGSYTRTWDTRTVPEGIYFVRLESASYRVSRKLVLALGVPPVRVRCGF